MPTMSAKAPTMSANAPTMCAKAPTMCAKAPTMRRLCADYERQGADQDRKGADHVRLASTMRGRLSTFHPFLRARGCFAQLTNNPTWPHWKCCVFVIEAHVA